MVGQVLGGKVMGEFLGGEGVGSAAQACIGKHRKVGKQPKGLKGRIHSREGQKAFVPKADCQFIF